MYFIENKKVLKVSEIINQVTESTEKYSESHGIAVLFVMEDSNVPDEQFAKQAEAICLAMPNYKGKKLITDLVRLRLNSGGQFLNSEIREGVEKGDTYHLHIDDDLAHIRSHLKLSYHYSPSIIALRQKGVNLVITGNYRTDGRVPDERQILPKGVSYVPEQLVYTTNVMMIRRSSSKDEVRLVRSILLPTGALVSFES